MRTGLTADQIKRYRDQGFLIHENLLSPVELGELTDAVMNAVAEMGDRKIKAVDWKDGDQYYDRVFVQRLNLWRDHPTIRRYLIESAIGEMASELAGVPLRVWHDQALNKQPWANPTSWHLDNPYWSFHSTNAISIWIALDDATLQNGCMYYLPGSHKLVTNDNVGIGPNVGDLFRLYPALGRIQPVPAPMKAGSCAFHNGLTAHGAGPNMTPGWRRAMTCAYMPAGSAFNGQQNILTPERMALLEVGDTLDDDVENPLVGSLVRQVDG